MKNRLKMYLLGIAAGIVVMGCFPDMGLGIPLGEKETAVSGGGTISFNQVLTPGSVPYGGGAGLIHISAQGDWTVSAPAGFTLSPASGTGDGVVTVTVPQNPGAAEREIRVTVDFGGGITKTVTITQVALMGEVIRNAAPPGSGYQGALTVRYGTGAGIAGTMQADGSVVMDSRPPANTLITKIEVGSKTYLIGRINDGGIPLNLDAAGVLQFNGGGTATDPYLINTYEEFQLINGLANTSGTFYRLEADLDLMGGRSGINDWVSVGNNSPKFTGAFDGGGHTLSNLHGTGLFGVVGPGGSISSIGIASGLVDGSSTLGAIAGENRGTITACYNKAPVSGTSTIGGIVGDNRGSVIACYNTGAINATGNTAGGVVGTNLGTVTACYNTGSVDATGYAVGSGPISACYYGPAAASATPGSAIAFSASWPTATGDWGTGDGSGTGKYWKALGAYNGGVYPTLWFE